MNRNSEYEKLLRELDDVRVPEDCVEKAMRRAKRSRYTLRTLSGIAAAFALFVILVNASTTVAYACSRVPGLRELVQAVTFSRSLSDAVKNEYVQPVNLSETNGEITVKVEYLIVDQKNVTVFYRLESGKYTHLEAEPVFAAADGEALEAGSWGANDWDVPNGELRSVHIGFAAADVPPALRMKLKLRNNEPVGRDDPPEPIGSIWDDVPSREPDYVAEFEFLLEFDPTFTAQGRHYELNERIELGDQTLRVTNVDVYPSYLSLTVEGDEANTAWLESLRFYLVTDRGERFDTIKNGVISVRDPERPEIISFRADSTFFYNARSVTLVAAEAEWLDKETGTIHVDLKNARADGMPEDSELVAAEREGKRWVVTVLQRQGSAQVFMDCYDADGKRYEIRQWASGPKGPDGMIMAPEGYFYDSFPINDYPYDEVWLTPRYTSVWKAAVPVSAVLELK